METSIRLSMTARQNAERKQHADQAREYGEKAVENAGGQILPMKIDRSGVQVTVS